jgi:hypothetical protein
MENCALNLANEIILYYDARSKKHQITPAMVLWNYCFKLYFMPSYVLMTEQESQATDLTQKNLDLGGGVGGGRH